ncbi:MAG: BMP family ABC transporter substrate-binding protein [Spirochaetes bacterium]|nr:BMP family ABC transporter substrate-binding protein [Spirochaetota bacterium]
MKRGRLLVVMVLLVLCSLTVFGQEKKQRVVMYLNGTLGGKTMFDSAALGVNQLIKENRITGKIIEGGYDKTRWQTDIATLSAAPWDIIITAGFSTAPYVTELAPQHPEKKFIIYDTSVDYSKGNLGNVYSILFKQNEPSFLAGVLAAMVTKSKMPLANQQKVIGFIGGMDIPVINDFKAGFLQGARYIDPEVKVLVSYSGTYNDPAKGKELALAQYSQGADIIFSVAGGTGLGVFDAAKSVKAYAIGVDTDQADMIQDQDPEKANLILTSVIKNAGAALYRAVVLTAKDSLKYGTAEYLGLSDSSVGLADNAIYRAQVPEEIRAKVESLEKMVLAGTIKVDTALGK